jgi:hypothetical protein
MKFNLLKCVLKEILFVTKLLAVHIFQEFQC